MIVACRGCFRRFRLDERLLQPDGSRVRCSKCGEVFRVRLETAAPDATGEQPEPGERRRFPRRGISIPALCNSTDADGRPLDLYIGVLKEISPAGAALELFPGTMSEVVGLSFIGADDKDVAINGRIRHATPCRSGKQRLGLALIGSPDDVRQFVSQAVRAHNLSVGL